MIPLMYGLGNRRFSRLFGKLPPISTKTFSAVGNS
jgi:hypothetical protein